VPRNIRPSELFTALAAGLVVLLGLANDAIAARPGAGQSFSSPSSSSSSFSSFSSTSYRSGSSSGDGADNGYLVILLLVSAIVGLVVFTFRTFIEIRKEREITERMYREFAGGRGGGAPTTGPALQERSARPVARLARRAGPRVSSRSLLEDDPDFSEIVFRDLAFRLYAEAYRAAADPRAVESLAPYLSAELCDQLRADLRGARCRAALVGELRIEGYTASEETLTISVIYTGNVHLDDAHGGGEKAVYVVERWEFSRRRGARTRPPEAIRRLGCPSCGAPFVRGDQRRCAHCGSIVEDGRLEWRAQSRRVLTWEVQPPTVTHSVVELGTDDPTIRQRGALRRLAELTTADPSVTSSSLEDRVAAIYAALNDGWNADEPRRFRPYVSDALFDYLRYWLSAYRAKGLRNQVTSMRLTAIHLAKVERDVFFDAVTLRVFATGLDFTLSSDDRVVSGSRRTERAYSEYWTLIRGRSAASAPSSDGRCPACSATLELNMAGECDGCGAHLTLGEFDWVLSRIEQDEVYRG